MAVLISSASGNLTSSGTWSLADATSYSDGLGGGTWVPNSSGSSARSVTFTPGAITIDGIGVKLYGRNTSGGTFTVNLYNSTDAVDVVGSSVTVNISDLPYISTGAGDDSFGWAFFKFSAPVTLVAGKAYSVQCVTSVASVVYLQCTYTANDWARFLRTTTNQAPAAGNDMHVMGEYTGIGTMNSLTVTMDSTASTIYGNGTTNLFTPAMSVCSGGTLSYGTTASTNYILKISGYFRVNAGGTFNIGTNGTPIPRTSTALLEFYTPSSSNYIYVLNLGTFNSYGLSRTSGKNITFCKLNANAASSATSLSVDTDTGWLNGDTIGIAPTSRTYNECDSMALNADAGASSLSLASGLTYAHSGTTPTQAEVINLTRNVRIRSTSSSSQINIYIRQGATATFIWTDLQTACITLQSYSTGTIQYCCLRDTYNCYTPAFTISNAATMTFSYNVSYNTYGTLSCQGGGAVVIDNNVMIKSGSSHIGLSSESAASQITNNSLSGASAYGVSLTSYASNYCLLSSFSNNIIHSNGAYGLYTSAVLVCATADSNSIWRNGANGIYFAATVAGLVLSNLTVFGNYDSNICTSGTSNQTGLVLRLENLLSAGDTSFSTTTGISIGGGAAFHDIELYNASFSNVTGIFTAHTNDLQFRSATSLAGKIIARHCKFGGSTFILTPGNADKTFYFGSQDHNQTSGDYRTLMFYGTAATDTTIYKTASPSIRLTPNDASNKLQSAPRLRGMLVACASGATATISCWLRKSAVGDGAAYNGNQPRLILRAGPEMGVSSDTVLATAAASTGTWEQLSGTTPTAASDGVFEVIVDCDGTAGWVNIDDFAAA